MAKGCCDRVTCLSYRMENIIFRAYKEEIVP